MNDMTQRRNICSVHTLPGVLLLPGLSLLRVFLQHGVSLLRVPLGRVLLLSVLMLWAFLPAAGQQFSVRSFRLLPNDISAYIHPVMDLNEEACALIKVVCESDFAFSTPLGIVKRSNEVGEVWLYVPSATRLLTLKHPRWGVVRDYRLPLRLESRMTYELTLHLPAAPAPSYMPKLHTQLPPLFRPQGRARMVTAWTPPVGRRRKEPLSYLLMAEMGLGGDYPTWGLRAGVMRRWGLYLMGRWDLRAVGETTESCNKEGQLLGSGSTPYYTGQVESRRYLATAGALWRMVDEWCLFGGVGYGSYLLAWQRAEGNLVKNEGHSAQGVAAELGVLYRLRHLTLSAGVNAIQMSQWEATLGVGLRF